ncbi:MAG: hypothetical protein H6R07_3179 [Proteobacteria bacterium]|nr:hypothetical protein [Pseudomonadota bacterium]
MKCKILYLLIVFFTAFAAFGASAQAGDFSGNYYVSSKDNPFFISISKDNKQWRAILSDGISDASSIKKFGPDPVILLIPSEEKENRYFANILKLNELPQCIKNSASNFPIICKTTQPFDYFSVKIRTELFMVGYGVVLEMKKQPLKPTPALKRDGTP